MAQVSITTQCPHCHKEHAVSISDTPFIIHPFGAADKKAVLSSGVVRVKELPEDITKFLNERGRLWYTT